MTPEQKRFYKDQQRTIREYHSAENTEARRAEQEAYEKQVQDDPNATRDNTLFLAVIFGTFAVLIALAMMFPV